MVGQQPKVDRSGRESMHMAGETRQTAADNETSPFFPESVLHTEHEHVSQYACPATGLLLAISRQANTTDRPKANTYCKWVCLQGPRRERVWMRAVIDGGAMLNMLCASEWEKQKDWLTLLQLSDVILSITDNHRIPSEGTWTGVMDVAGAKMTQSFEVFDSNGTFEVILGKLWLKSVQVTHHYTTDEITMTIEGRTTMLTNETTDHAEV